MSDLIDRKTALRDYQDICDGVACYDCPFCVEGEVSGCKLEAYIKGLPSAEKTGRWETFSPFSRPRCSVCGELCIGTHAFDYTLTDYCPNCGARMEG